MLGLSPDGTDHDGPGRTGLSEGSHRMTTPHVDQSLSRRTALAGLTAGGLGVALAATTRSASAQDAATEMANHPIVGVWNAMTPGGPAPGIFFPTGIALMTPQVTQVGPERRDLRHQSGRGVGAGQRPRRPLHRCPDPLRRGRHLRRTASLSTATRW